MKSLTSAAGRPLVGRVVRASHFPKAIPAVTTFGYELSGITASALVRSSGGDGYAYRTICCLRRDGAACFTSLGKLVPAAISGGASRS